MVMADRRRPEYGVVGIPADADCLVISCEDPVSAFAIIHVSNDLAFFKAIVNIHSS
jgi:hypothetical protein